VQKRKLVQSVNSRYTECDNRKKKICGIVLISQEMKSKKGGTYPQEIMKTKFHNLLYFYMGG